MQIEYGHPVDWRRLLMMTAILLRALTSLQKVLIKVLADDKRDRTYDFAAIQQTASSNASVSKAASGF